ncbi:hypothetical protein XBJ1_4187 [Xenorhabdus bovienii SS-2004]|uniref:Uncharacterized protein n=1 Tax=Xenorhabdus bovienii (strain SS-2004) TaxID=406818 RepID=D3V6M0_XENBS|nr:hypothetical protein XBJ1_4187 [Xenorhabdus bovienii SS-2004]
MYILAKKPNYILFISLSNHDNKYLFHCFHLNINKLKSTKNFIFNNNFN